MAENKARIPTQKRSIEKKENIKKTALLLFSERGYHNVSTNEIAKNTGVSIGTLYSYYKNKTDIYADIVKDIYSDVFDALTKHQEVPPTNPKELIRGYITLVIKSHSYMTDFQRQMTSLSYEDPSFRKMEDSYRSESAKNILSMLSEYQDELQVTDLKTASYVIQTTVESIVHELSFFEDGYDKNKVINEFTDMLYRYLFTTSAK